MHGTDVPKGGLLRLSPCELAHSILHNVAKAIRTNQPEHVMKKWLRVLLSFPVILVRKQTEDLKWAEANSLRGDFQDIAASVVFTTRQFIYCIYGFLVFITLIAIYLPSI